uniref:EGF-like domain-containing protein n=1 Tax=Meloidogyne hapla TaxID=6305 RepID=A0A1I8BL22_MELHA
MMIAVNNLVDFKFLYLLLIYTNNSECSGDNSDEEECGHYKCPPDMWPCPNSGHCIPLGKLCNGINDCDGGMDEKTCSRNLCQTLGCQSGCASSPTGGICTCPQGYKLDERFQRSCIG